MSAKTAAIEIVCRDPEDRQVDERDPAKIREKMLDKTIADSFPASDPPSTDPAPRPILLLHDYATISDAR